MKVWFTWLVAIQEAMSDYNIIEKVSTIFLPLTRGFPQRIYHALVISVCGIWDDGDGQELSSATFLIIWGEIALQTNNIITSCKFDSNTIIDEVDEIDFNVIKKACMDD